MARVLFCLTIVGMLVAGAGCKTTEYLYSHTIAGKVVDAGGTPLAGAKVIRGTSPDATSGLPASLYERLTDQNGSFAFEYSGLGPEPEPEDTWHLIATKDGFERVVQTIAIPWTSFKKDAPVGYIKREIVITLRPTVEAAAETGPAPDAPAPKAEEPAP